MEETPTSSNVLPPGLSYGSVAAPAPSGTGRSPGISRSQAALSLRDCASGFRGLRGIRGHQDHIPSNHSVEANRRPAVPLDVGSQLGSHFHAIYGDHNAVFAIETLARLEGDLPPRAHRLVQEWAAEHQADLREMWRTQIFRALPGLE